MTIPTSLIDHLTSRLAALAPGFPEVRLCVAFSGGVDSLALLHAVRELAAHQTSITLRAIHVNDSKGDLGCRKDRHEHIGKGTVGLEAFGRILNDRRFSAVPMVLETPKDEKTLAEDRENLSVLRRLVRH